jgi:hypothetical protein
MSDLSLIHDSDPSSSSHDYEEHPLYPYKAWLAWLYKELVEQGFYTPHVSVYYQCMHSRLLEGALATSGFNLTVTMRVCASPPSKTDFLNALYFIASPSLGQDTDEPLHG